MLGSATVPESWLYLVSGLKDQALDLPAPNPTATIVPVKK